MRTILLIATGGTIASRPTAAGVRAVLRDAGRCPLAAAGCPPGGCCAAAGRFWCCDGWAD